MIVKYRKRWYTPKQVAENGLILSPKSPDSLEASYRFVISLIKQGTLPAKQYGRNPEYPYYLVSEQAIEAYNREGAI